MGITDLVLVKPSRLAVPEHEMARKMAVKSWDVLESSRRVATLAEALADSAVAFATTSHRGVSGVMVPKEAAARALELSARRERTAFVFGNEKTGLSQDDVRLCDFCVRIPMAADQPSVNLAQSVQIVAYELFLVGLEARNAAAKAD